jgi:hypothetical protein
MKNILIFLLAIGLSLSLFAQEKIDILSLSGRYGLPKEYKDATYTGKATEWGSLNSLTAGIKLGSRSMLAINVNHFYFNVQNAPTPEFPNDIANHIKINGFILRTGLIQDFGEGRALQVLIAPRLMSDFANVDSRSFQMGAVVSYKKKYRDEFSIGGGLIYNQELFGPYFVPILDLNWQFASKWKLKGMIPVTARIEYTVSENLQLGFNHFGLITTYALGKEAYTGDYMERQSIDLSLFARQRLFGDIFIEGMVGRALGRKYRQYEGDQKVNFAIPLVTFGDERVIKNEVAEFSDGLILTLKLIYSIPMPE